MIPHEDNAAAVVDQYCVCPSCSCTDVILGFFPMDGPSPDSRICTEPLAFVKYDYRTKFFALADPERFPGQQTLARTLMGSLRGVLSTLDEEVGFRQHLLRKLAYNWLKRKRGPDLGGYAPEIPFAPKRKIGPNEPCPCGSG